jgi:hypothetical protein
MSAYIRLWHDSDLEAWAACRLCPGISDIDLLGDRQGVVNLDPEITDRALDLGVTEQQLNGPEVAGPAIDQGSFCPT